MTRQFYQDPNDHSGHHHTHQAPYPYPNLSKQPGQSTQPFHFVKPNPQDTYDDRSRQYEPPTSVPHRSHGHPQPHLKTSHKLPNTSSLTHQQGRQDLYGYPSTGSSSNDLYYPGGGLVNGGGDNYLPPGGGYNPARPQDRKPAGYDRGHNSRPKPSKRPARPPANTHTASCRIPQCNKPAFFDKRVNEFREWCSDEHMQLAIMHRVEEPCNICRVWPCRKGYEYCCGNYCRNPGLSAHVR